MSPERLRELAGHYSKLRIALLGDFCLDRYLEIDPAKQEVSIETGLPVYNVVNVRAQPGGAGTILNNLVALGIGEISPIGFAGFDGEGYELARSLENLAGVNRDHFLQAAERRTFTYCKPLLVEKGKAPVELNRLDSKNWTPTPLALQQRLAVQLATVAPSLDAVIVLDQVDVAETGVITPAVLQQLSQLVSSRLDLLVIADSRRGLKGYPPVCMKMNRAEFGKLTGRAESSPIDQLRTEAATLAKEQGRSVFITLADEGIVGAHPSGECHHVPAHPVRGEIDIVGAGDSVTANLTSALAAGATLLETLQIAMLASSVVIHKLGTTGTANLEELVALCRV